MFLQRPAEGPPTPKRRTSGIGLRVRRDLPETTGFHNAKTRWELLSARLVNRVPVDRACC